MPLHIALVHPLIPQNTGSVARLCAGTGIFLHLVKPTGFDLSDRLLKRAGLDYWPDVRLFIHESFEDMVASWRPAALALFSSHATRGYDTCPDHDETWLVFGSETTGLPVELRQAYADALYKIPMNGRIRSLNLSNSVSVVAYDVLRRRGFPGLS
jgi:tRNA (cytidine/uridine-2'-O-)-methyltransferase